MPLELNLSLKLPLPLTEADVANIYFLIKYVELFYWSTYN